MRVRFCVSALPLGDIRHEEVECEQRKLCLQPAFFWLVLMGWWNSVEFIFTEQI